MKDCFVVVFFGKNTSKMKKILILLLFIFVKTFSFGQEGKNELCVVQSEYDFTTTLDRLYKVLENKQLDVFADFNHQKNAHEVAQKMPQSRVVVFGNPKVGTKLMLDNPQIALDLPLKIAVVEDKNQKVQLVFTNMVTLAEKYAIKDRAIVEKMQEMLENIAFLTAKPH